MEGRGWLPARGVEDILNLSDPPYYTACPNPWIGDFIAFWDVEKMRRTDAGERRKDERNDIPVSPCPPIPDPYHREPFAADVSEGKNHPIYNAHSYHTKVPHKAIMRHILHYTEPGVKGRLYSATWVMKNRPPLCVKIEPMFHSQNENNNPQTRIRRDFSGIFQF